MLRKQGVKALGRARVERVSGEERERKRNRKRETVRERQRDREEEEGGAARLCRLFPVIKNKHLQLVGLGAGACQEDLGPELWLSNKCSQREGSGGWGRVGGGSRGAACS